jgi:THO complex subunit 2
LNTFLIQVSLLLSYKQQKFNLLREESEGYSKLITELNQREINEHVLQNIQSLIGKFYLLRLKLI